MASPLAGRLVLITSGPTREHLDPIRYLTNSSSGRTGVALAKAAAARGARVVVVSGPSELAFPPSITVVRVTTGLQMHAAVLRRAKRADVIIGAAAVSDWRFSKSSDRKIKRKPGALRLTLLPNPDIIKAAARRRPKGRDQIIVGFALETHDALSHAKQKLERKGLDAVVVNGPSALAGKTSAAVLLLRGGAARNLGKGAKSAIARRIIKEVERIFERRTEGADAPVKKSR